MSVLAHEGRFPILYGSYAVPVGSGHSPGYLARPDQAGRFPAVLVLPDSPLTSHHKDLCRRLARHGLAAVAVDLESGNAVARIAETCDFANQWAIKDQFGLLGLGAGGEPGLVYAADHPEIAAVALVSTPLAVDGPVATALPRLAIPVLGLYGDSAGVDDGRIPRGSFVVYRDVAAGFLDAGAAEYDAAASADAYRRLVDFFSRTLPRAEVEALG